MSGFALSTEDAVERLMGIAFKYVALTGRRSEVQAEFRLILQSHALSSHLSLAVKPDNGTPQGKLDTMQSEFLIPCPHCDRPVRIRAVAG